jgi:V8-like Glu-specific endopeptidase
MKKLILTTLLFSTQAFSFNEGTVMKTPEDLVRKILITKGHSAFECSATFIAKGILLTAAHCVNIEGKTAPHDSVVLLSNKQDIEPVARSMFVWAHPNFSMVQAGSKNDVAIVVFERSIVKDEQVANIELASTPVNPKDTHSIISYLSDSDKLIQMRNNLEIEKVDEKGVLHGDMTGRGTRLCRGDSGSAVIRELDGKIQVVGVSSSVSMYLLRPFANKKTCLPNRTVNFAGISANKELLEKVIAIGTEARTKLKALRKESKSECLGLYDDSWNKEFVDIVCSYTLNPKKTYLCTESELNYLNVTAPYNDLSEKKKLVQVIGHCLDGMPSARDSKIK